VSPNGAERVGTVDLREYGGRVLTWTTSMATPPGVREPNTLAIVEFDMNDEYDGPAVRALGQIAEREDSSGETFDVDIGDRVEPVYRRTPRAGRRDPRAREPGLGRVPIPSGRSLTGRTVSRFTARLCCRLLKR